MKRDIPDRGVMKTDGGAGYSDIRDTMLGEALRRSVGSIAGDDPAWFQAIATRAINGRVVEVSVGRRTHKPVLAAAAAVVVIGLAAAGFGIAGYGGIRSSSLETARAIMPERSLWVPDALAGDGESTDPVAEFIDCLWFEGAETKSFGTAF